MFSRIEFIILNENDWPVSCVPLELSLNSSIRCVLVFRFGTSRTLNTKMESDLDSVAPIIDISLLLPIFAGKKNNRYQSSPLK